MHVPVQQWLRERGVEQPNTVPSIPEQKLEGGICGRVARRLLPCQLPDGHEGDCDPEFERQAADANERVREARW